MVFAALKKITPPTLATFILILNVVFSCASYSAKAEKLQVPIKFEQISAKQGLSQSTVYSIAQDDRGFIWLATEDGLNRFDGKNFKYYRHNLSNPNSLANNLVRKLFKDNRGNLWVGTQEGLSKYNYATDQFENYYHDNNDRNSLKDNVVWSIYQDKNEELWISTADGLHKYDYQQNNFIRMRVRGLENDSIEIRSIFQDSRRNFWFGTFEKGVLISSPNLSEKVKISPRLENELKKASTLYQVKEVNGNYWLGTNNGIYIVDQNYNLTYQLNTKTSSLTTNDIRVIEQSNETTLWIGTNKGAFYFDLKTKSIRFDNPEQTQQTLPVTNIFDIFKTNSGNFLIGTFGHGLYLHKPHYRIFEHFLTNQNSQRLSIESIVETKDGSVWLTSSGKGLLHLEQSGFLTTINLPIPDDIFQIKTSKNNELWFITYNNDLYKYDAIKKQLTPHAKWKALSFFDNLYNFSIYEEHIIFIDMEGFLVSYNTESETFEHFQPNNSTELGAFYLDNEGVIWLTSSSEQLYQFNWNTKEFLELKTELKADFPISQVLDVKVSNQWIWLASTSQGIALVERNSGKATLFNENNKLNNNYINSILLDDSENAWVSTNVGISVINPQNKKVKNYDIDFGLNDNEFLKSSSLRSSDGSFFFGGINGFNTVNPLELEKLKQLITPPQLTNLLIANQEITINTGQESSAERSKFTISKQLNLINKLTLAHAQSPFSIEFIVPNAQLPEQLKYRYRLKGLEENWIESGENNYRATYTNLSHGDYVFEVQAYDAHFPENQATKQLNINILPPWWLTTQAIMLYSLAVALFIVYILLQIRNKQQFHVQLQQSEERLKLSLWGSGDEMWDWNIKTGKIYRSNIWGILDFPKEQNKIAEQATDGSTFKESTTQTNIHEQDMPRVKAALQAHFNDKTEHFEATYRIKDINGNWVWVLDRGKVVERDDKNKPTRMTGTLKDISHIKTAEERLKLFARCIENISDAVVIYDKQFFVVDVNKAFIRITGKSKKEMLGKSLNFNRYAKSFTHSVKKHLLTKGGWYGEIESRRSNGEIYQTYLNIDIIYDEDGSVSNFVGVFSDITERKIAEEELRKLANTDTLTGLPNRSYFQANQTRLVDSNVPHALLVFDLDNFKKINDSLGHEAGDELLCQVASRLKKVGRKQDTIYRLGGDEFSLIIENTNDIHTITSIAKSIIKTIAQPIKLKNHEVVLHCSIGIVLCPEDGNSPLELLKNADTAMYHAKDIGGNKYQFFNGSMNKQAVKRLQVENLIRYGLREDCFSVFYQPKIEIKTGKIAGMEALVRFQTPDRGIISPATFIPISEETGQIIEIGETVLRKACYATKKWVDAGLFDGRIAVNLSAVQFTQHNLVEIIANILKETRLPAEYLELEITEGTVMDSPQTAIDIMGQIRAMGIHLSLDDFGTGYSSLAYLKKFPLNTLKIDKAFVDDIEHSEQGRNMVATIVTIAHNLDLHVVAEGVENERQLNFLSGLRCEQLQGYLYSKPLDEQDFARYLISHRIANKSTAFS